MARSLFNWPNTLVLLLVHGRDCWIAMREEAKILTRESHRFKVEQLDLDDPGEAEECASMAMARYPSIKSLVLDAKAMPEPRDREDGSNHPVGRAMRGALVAFNALRPYFAGNMRVMVVSSHMGIQAQWLTSKPWQAELFRNAALDLARLDGIVEQFAEDHAAAVKRMALLPSRAPSGLWLDINGFGFVLLHALLCVWHRQHTRLNICACCCLRERSDLDSEEVGTVVRVMSDDSLEFASVSQQLFGNHAQRMPWFSDDRLLDY